MICSALLWCFLPQPYECSTWNYALLSVCSDVSEHLLFTNMSPPHRFSAYKNACPLRFWPSATKKRKLDVWDIIKMMSQTSNLRFSVMGDQKRKGHGFLYALNLCKPSLLKNTFVFAYIELTHVLGIIFDFFSARA